MPDEIRRLQERAANADCVPRQEAIRSRISAIMPLYRLSRYRPTQPPRQSSIGSAAHRAGDEPAGRTATRPQARSTTDRRETAHAPGEQRPARDGSGRSCPENPPTACWPMRLVDLPDVAWISARDGIPRRRRPRGPSRPLPPRTATS